MGVQICEGDAANVLPGVGWNFVFGLVVPSLGAKGTET